MQNASISNMKTLTLKNVPDETYARIGRVAKANSRSLNRQAILLLERRAAMSLKSILTQNLRS